MKSPNPGSFLNEEVEVTKVHSNLSQEIVKITVDRLQLIINDHLQDVEQRNRWGTPLGMLLTMLIVFPTTDFKILLGIKGEAWQAIFILSAVSTFFWLIKTVSDAYKAPTVKDIIERIKRGS